MPKVVANEINMHYWQMGAGEDVILVHGLGGNLAMWYLTMAPDLQRTFRVTTYDLRGHGYSDAPSSEYSLPDLVADLRALMDTLGIERAHFVGHCLGADIALHFALNYPDRAGRIVVIEAMLTTLAEHYRRPEWEGWAYAAKSLDALAGIKVPREKWHDIEYLLQQSLAVPIVYGPSRGRQREREPVNRLLSVLKLVQESERRDAVADLIGELTLDNLARITQAVLLMYETDSLFAKSYEVLQDRLPNASSVTVPEGKLKHLSAMEYPEMMASHIKAFLQPGQPVALAAIEDR